MAFVKWKYKKKSDDNNKLNKQNLYVLTDIDEYIIFSTQTTKNKKFPLHYFIVSKEGKFYHFNNVYGTESPEYIIANASKRVNETKFTCKKLWLNKFSYFSDYWKNNANLAKITPN